MTLAEASAEFLEEKKPARSHPSTDEHTLEVLSRFFSPAAELRDITPTRVREFLSRWYIDEAVASRCSLSPDDASKVVDSISEFFAWADQRGEINSGSGLFQILAELRQTLPRALEVMRDLSIWMRERRGAFGFPEFLTSFEQGGRSEYDIDTPGDSGTLEGYFRIVRVDGSRVEAEELISERVVSPIEVPSAIASKLDNEYIINLELTRTSSGWEISDCGITYPPGTDI